MYNKNIVFICKTQKNFLPIAKSFLPNSHPDIKWKIIKGLNSEPIRIHLISSAIKQAIAEGLCKMYFVNETKFFFNGKKRNVCIQLETKQPKPVSRRVLVVLWSSITFSLQNLWSTFLFYCVHTKEHFVTHFQFL